VVTAQQFLKTRFMATAKPFGVRDVAPRSTFSRMGSPRMCPLPAGRLQVRQEPFRKVSRRYCLPEEGRATWSANNTSRLRPLDAILQTLETAQERAEAVGLTVDEVEAIDERKRARMLHSFLLVENVSASLRPKVLTLSGSQDQSRNPG
jgi:hypothetical protein